MNVPTLPPGFPASLAGDFQGRSAVSPPDHVRSGSCLQLGELVAPQREARPREPRNLTEVRDKEHLK